MTFRPPDEAALKELQDRLRKGGTVRRISMDDAPVSKPGNSKPGKYRNRRVAIDGLIFDSQAEADRWAELQALERSGAISDLRRQVRYELAPAVTVQGRKRPPIRYIADFVYERDGQKFTEDRKGYRTEVYRLKRHLMMAIHGIEILET